MDAEQTVDAATFRQAMATFATGVAVATAADASGGAGITVNSFTSVSLSPPLLLWCLGEHSARYDLFARTPHFAVSILAADQEALSRRFAAEALIEATDDTVVRASNGAPLLRGALAWFECDVTARHTHGDHLVIVGQVTRASSRPDGAGLTYFRSGYGRMG